MEVVVFGAGSLGSLIGGLLSRERDHAVTLVGRDPHVETVREDGLRIDGEVTAHVSPEATTDGAGLDADLAIITVKAYDTTAAARTLASGSIDVCLSLQNGVGNESVLAEHLSSPVLAGTATYGAVLDEPGRVRCTGVGEVVLGDRDGGSSSVADAIGDSFSAAGVETTVTDSMPERQWEKLAVNTGINPVTALADVKNGFVGDDRAPDAESDTDFGTDSGWVAREAARETARVARERGIALTENRAVSRLESVSRETAANVSSMAQDARSGRRSEIDSINGFVVGAADRAGVAVPVNRTLTSLVRTVERERGLR